MPFDSDMMMKPSPQLSLTMVETRPEAPLLIEKYQHLHSHQDSCSRIADWLSNISNIPPDITSKTNLTRQRASRKRKAPAPAHRHHHQHQLPSPSLSSMAESQYGSDEDNEPTPKRPRLNRNTTDTPGFMALQGRPMLAPHTSSKSAPSVSVPASASSQSAKSDRSGTGSPVRRMAAMMFNPRPIEPRGLQASDPNLPPALTALMKRLRPLSRGIGVLPARLRGSSTLATLEDEPDEIFDRGNERDRLGPVPSGAAVQTILRRADGCAQDGQCEASWNCYVHTEILLQALENDKFRDSVDSVNCTSARIYPKSLLPQHYTGTKIGSKMVDFAIRLRIKDDPVVKAATRSLAIRENGREFSLSHTNYGPLMAQPIAISIETKPQGQAWDVAQIQLGVWAAAHFVRLEQLAQLCHGSTSISPEPWKLPGQDQLFLPLILVQGHDWHFLAASRDREGAFCLWNKLTLGSTESALGIYQLIASLQVLATWATDTYKPWFYSHILEIEPPEIASRTLSDTVGDNNVASGDSFGQLTAE